MPRAGLPKSALLRLSISGGLLHETVSASYVRPGAADRRWRRGGTGLETADVDEEAYEWIEGRGVGGSLGADFWFVHQLWNRLSAGAGRPHRLCASFRAHDV